MKRDGLYRRENGIFAFRYKDGAGRWREKYTGEVDRDEALKFKREFEDNLAKGTLPTDKAQWTVEQACTRWVEQHSAHLGSHQAKRNEYCLLRQLVRRLGSRKLKSITLDDLKTYQANRHQEVGECAVNFELRILVRTLKEANLWHPIEKHYKPLKERESDIGRALSLDELRRLEIAAQQNDRWLVAYNAELLAANSGLRGGEIKRLKLGDVDLEARRLRIRRKGTKTAAGARLIELNQAATQACTRLYLRAQALGASDPGHYLLPADLSRHTKASDPVKGIGFDATQHQQSWRSAWRSLLKAARLEGLRFHDLRHSFISLMAERGVPLAVVQSMVGHLSARMTRYYTHISSQAARQAVELLDRLPIVGKFVGTEPQRKLEAAKLFN